MNFFFSIWGSVGFLYLSMFVFSFQKYIFFSLLQIKIFIFFHLEFFFKIKIFRKIIILILSYYLAQYNKKERISLGGLTKAMPLTIAVTFQRTSSFKPGQGIGFSFINSNWKKKDTIYSSDLLSQPKSRSVGSRTALLLLCAHSIHPPSLLLNIIYIFVLYQRIYRKRD
jgi:hypothetical protein